MGCVFAIWQWRTAWPFKSPEKVYKVIATDRSPLALVRFDTAAVHSSLLEDFGADTESPLINVIEGNFTGNRANWIFIEVTWLHLESLVDRLQQFVGARGLYLHYIGE